MNGPTMLTKEMKTRKGGRFRRFQALDDALIMFFNFQEHPYWLGTTQVLEMMEWENTHTTRKRTRRIAESLVRIGKLEANRTHGGSRARFERMWRILE